MPPGGLAVKTHSEQLGEVEAELISEKHSSFDACSSAEEVGELQVPDDRMPFNYTEISDR